MSMNIFKRKKGTADNNNNASSNDPETILAELRQRKDILRKQLEATEAQERVYSGNRVGNNVPREREAMAMLRQKAEAQKAAQVRNQQPPPPQPQPQSQFGDQYMGQYAIPAEKLRQDTAVGSWLITIYEQYPLTASQRRAMMIVLSEKVPWYVAELQALSAAHHPPTPNQTRQASETQQQDDQDNPSDEIENAEGIDNLLEEITG